MKKFTIKNVFFICIMNSFCVGSLFAFDNRDLEKNDCSGGSEKHGEQSWIAVEALIKNLTTG